MISVESVYNIHVMLRLPLDRFDMAFVIYCSLKCCVQKLLIRNQKQLK